MRTLRGTVVIGTVAALQLVGPTAGADAFHGHIKALKVQSIAISDQSCQRINVTIKTTRGVGYVKTNAHRGRQVVASLAVDTPGGVGYDYLRWCPGASLGKYRMGPSQLCGTDSLGYDFCFGEDKTVTPFFVRRFARVEASRAGSVVSGRVKAYSMSKRTYVGVRGVRVSMTGDSGRSGRGGRFTLHGSGSRVTSATTATVAAAHDRV